MQYRRFNFIQSRLLLEKQEKLRNLEKELDTLDQDMFDSDPTSLATQDIGSRTFLDNPTEKVIARKTALFDELEKQYIAYGKTSIRSRSISI
jgi:hypothetical protein